MADYMDDDEQAQAGLAADLSGGGAISIAPFGLADNLRTPAPPAVGVIAPVAVSQAKIPTYIDSRDGTVVSLSRGVSPGAFAAEQQSPWENLLSGYGAETMNFGRQAANLAQRAVSAVQGNTGTVPAIQNPNKDIDKALFKTSLAADGGRMLSDFVNTYPVAGVAGDLAMPIAQSIRGETLLPTITRAAIPGVAKGVATAVAIPADDSDERLHHILVRGGFGLRPIVRPILDALASYR